MGDPAAPTTTGLPAWRRVLAVIAHPDDESFGLGAVLGTFADAGAEVHVLCLTHGEASTLHGVTGDLREVRARELGAAATALGLAKVTLCDHPDGALDTVQPAVIERDIEAAMRGNEFDGVVVFDPSGVTGHPDHVAATMAAIRVARQRSAPVLAWTLPKEVATLLNTETGASFSGHRADQIDLRIPVRREPQRLACHAHASQALPTSVLWRRLDLLGGCEHLRWV